MKNIFCTLFDSGYMIRGISMYQSLLNTGADFELYVFAFDDAACRYLKQLDMPHLHVVSLAEFEDERLLTIKKTRTRGEYCWTCSGFSILYMLKHYDISEITYLDADMFFFSKPDVLLDEFHQSGKDVMITEHRYTPEYDQTTTSGKYCVQFMTFKNNKNGIKVLNWWCDRCEEWCYARFEDGKFGDQKYLDDWMTRFDCVHELQYIGGGVAPWNVQQYQIEPGPKVEGKRVVFYHFEALKWLKFDWFDLSQYKLSKDIIKYFYYPYIDMLKAMATMVTGKLGKDFSVRYNKHYDGFIGQLKYVKAILVRSRKGNFNVISR